MNKMVSISMYLYSISVFFTWMTMYDTEVWYVDNCFQSWTLKTENAQLKLRYSKKVTKLEKYIPILYEFCTL